MLVERVRFVVLGIIYTVVDANVTPLYHSNVCQLNDFTKEGVQAIDAAWQCAGTENDPAEIDVIITFTNAGLELESKLRVMITSLFRHTSVAVALHIIGDKTSQRIAEEIITTSTQYCTGNVTYRIVKLDLDQFVSRIYAKIKKLKQYFGGRPGSYYNQDLFFLSIAIHELMPNTMHRAIMLDVDMKFRDNIKKLYDHFQSFMENNVIGIAREMQPVYRVFFSQYRSENPGTRVGEPGPGGLTGFNSGVLLLDLDAMRESSLYNYMLNIYVITRLIEEFHFEGYLGDQDIFTLISVKHEQLFYILPCNWNRQLCVWFRDHGCAEVFYRYHICEGDVKIWHGNCNTTIPND